MKRIGITGSRSRNSPDDFERLENKFFELYENGDIIISGGAKAGADHFAQIIADRSNGKISHVPFEATPELYMKYGRKAPLIRNTRIAKESDILIAMPNPDSRTQGTMDTVTKFLEIHNNDKTKLYLI